MNGKPYPITEGGRSRWWAAGIVVLAAAGLVSPARGQGQPAASATRAVFAETSNSNVQNAVVDGPTVGGVVPAGCSSCGGLLGAGHGLGHGGGCDSCRTCCYPGQKPCGDCGHDTHFGRMFHELIECICCKDPCYEPRWIAAANAAFFTDATRPRSQMMIRNDAGNNLIFPDRHEFFWSKAVGPETGVNYDEVRIYTEGATERFGAFVDIGFRFTNPEVTDDECGFGDMVVGTKALLCDCELLQVAFQFKTFIPTGQPEGKGVGTGHVSLEPGILWTLKLKHDCYLQSQEAFWIPVGGDVDYTPCFIFHYHFSLNKVLCNWCDAVQLVGTAEANGWSVPGNDWDGALTDPATGATLPDNSTIITAGPGLRVVYCDILDFGLGTAYAVTSDRWAEQLYRFEFRWRY